MAVTESNYTGNGSQTTYTIGFPFINEADVKAAINGTMTTAFTIPNATQLTFDVAPANGAAIRIFRETDIENLTALFSAGGSWRGVDLNDNFYQLLYVNQETREITIQASTGNIPDGSITGTKIASNTISSGNINPNDLYVVPG